MTPGRDGFGEFVSLHSGATLNGLASVVVGAGASVDVGLPDWARLTAAMTARLAVEPGGLSDENWQRCVMEAIAGADLPWVMELFDEAPAFRVALRKLLYSEIKPDWPRNGAPWPRQVPKQARGGRELKPFHLTALKHLARLAIWSAWASPGRPFHATTYNLDCLLEEAIAAQGHVAIAIGPNGRAVVKAPVGARVEPYLAPQRSSGFFVRVAHPHGFLTREEHVDPATAHTEPVKPVDRMDIGGTVLTAREYDERLVNPLAAENVWQLMTYSRLSCLLYGWGFNDPAVRRLMRTAAGFVAKQHNLVGASPRRWRPKAAWPDGDRMHWALRDHRRVPDRDFEADGRTQPDPARVDLSRASLRDELTAREFVALMKRFRIRTIHARFQRQVQMLALLVRRIELDAPDRLADWHTIRQRALSGLPF